MTDTNTINRIAELNDMLRMIFFAGGRVFMTEGIRTLDAEVALYFPNGSQH